MDPRDRASTDLLLDHLDAFEPPRRAFLVEPPDPAIAARLRADGAAVDVWHRRAAGGRRATAWPDLPEEPVADLALVRLPVAKDELEMDAHVALSRLRPGGWLVVYGAADEGAASVPGRLRTLVPRMDTLATGGRCRLLSGLWSGRTVGGGSPRGGQDAWRRTGPPPHAELAAERWVGYPGVFAEGRLDPGTSALLDLLPPLPEGGRVLDFGAGDGTVAGVIAARGPDRPLDLLDLLDVDALALSAAAENVPGARTVVSDGWPEGAGRWTAIVSNPPYHRGKRETTEVLETLVRGAPAALEPEGWLALVAQRRLPVEDALTRAFGSAPEVLGDRGPFRVWRARRER